MLPVRSHVTVRGGRRRARSSSVRHVARGPGPPGPGRGACLQRAPGVRRRRPARRLVPRGPRPRPRRRVVVGVQVGSGPGDGQPGADQPPQGGRGVGPRHRHRVPGRVRTDPGRRCCRASRSWASSASTEPCATSWACSRCARRSAGRDRSCRSRTSPRRALIRADALGARSVGELVAGTRRRGTVAGPRTRRPIARSVGAVVPDLSDVQGHTIARRALEVAAAGGHHLLMVGPPGSGKTMLAERLPGLLPDLDDVGALDVSRVHSAAGALRGADAAAAPTAVPVAAPHGVARGPGGRRFVGAPSGRDLVGQRRGAVPG